MICKHCESKDALLDAVTEQLRLSIIDAANNEAEANSLQDKLADRDAEIERLRRAYEDAIDFIRGQSGQGAKYVGTALIDRVMRRP